MWQCTWLQALLVLTLCSFNLLDKGRWILFKLVATSFAPTLPRVLSLGFFFLLFSARVWARCKSLGFAFKPWCPFVWFPAHKQQEPNYCTVQRFVQLCKFFVRIDTYGTQEQHIQTWYKSKNLQRLHRAATVNANIHCQTWNLQPNKRHNSLVTQPQLWPPNKALYLCNWVDPLLSLYVQAAAQCRRSVSLLIKWSYSLCAPLCSAHCDKLHVTAEVCKELNMAA